MVNSIFILNKDKRIVDVLSNNGDSPQSPFFDDLYKQHLDTGAETFEFSTFSTERINKHCEVGSYVAFKYENKIKMFQIIETEDEHSEGMIIKSCYCEIAGLELINNVIRATEMQAVNVEQFFKTVLKDTPWALGLVDMAINTVANVKIEKATNVYSVIQDNLDVFDIEIEYRVEMAGQRVVGQFIDLHRQRGRETRKRFEYGVNVSGVSKQIDISNLCTAMIGIGKGGLDFKSVEWLSDKPAPKPLNQDFIVNPVAYEQWNRQGEQLMGVYENSECESPHELLQLTWNALVKASVPNFTYDVATEMIKGDEEELNLGDTVYVIDNDYVPALHLSARVGQLEISFTDHTKNKCILTNFKDVKSGVLSLETIQAIIDGKFPITGNEIVDGTITGDKIGQGQITGLLIKADAIEAKHITANAITSKQIHAGAITADKLTTGELITNSAQIKEGIIGKVQIAEGSIDNVRIENGAITSVKIGDGQVGTLQVADAAITNGKIANLAVDDAKIRNLNAEKITAGQIAADRLTANVIEAINASIGKITADHIDVDSIVVDNIDAGKITTGTLDADRITSSVITAINASLENATIDQAKIGNLDASKITTGQLSADIIKTNVISAINASLGSATINSAKIGNLDASKITSGYISADRIKAGTIDATKISADAISSISVNASNVVADKIAAGDIKVGNANILDGTISGAKITNATITNAQMSSAFIADGYIKNLNADKITSGSLNTTKVSMNSTSGQLSIADNTIQIKDNQATPKVRVQIGKDKLNNYGILVMNANGEAIFDSDRGVLSPNGLNSNVITADKIRDGEIGPSKLQVDEIWASEGFIGNFQAQEINAAKLVNLEAIDTKRLDINGLVSFNSLSTDMKGSFTQEGGKTFIDGGNIKTGTLSAKQLNTRGFTASDAAGNTTFNIDDATGKVSMSGLVESIGFSDVAGAHKGYQLTPEGKATLNDAVLRGSVILPQAGITNAENPAGCNVSLFGEPTPYSGANRQVRFWAGADFESRCDAPFIVYSDGKIKATEGEFGGTFTGKLSIGNIHIEDTNNSKGAIDVKTNNDAKTMIHLEEDNSYINSNLALGANFINISPTNAIMDMRGKLNITNSSNYTTTMGNEGNILRTTDGTNEYMQRYSNGKFVFDSYGKQSTDYIFTKESSKAPVNVEVWGDLKVRDKITMNNNISIVSRQDAGNSGFDFVVG